MDSHAPPNCRPLVGPGNTNHALDGPRRRPRFLQCFVIDMENTSTQQKTPKPASALGFVFFLHVDARCEPYGRRFGSARNNKANRFFSSVIILLIYMAKATGSSGVEDCRADQFVKMRIVGGRLLTPIRRH